MDVGWLARLLTSFFTSKSRDLITVQMGAKLTLMKYGIVGPQAKAGAYFLRGVFAVAIDSGVFLIDLTKDAIVLGMQDSEFKEEAGKLYEHTIKRIYSPEEKEKIRQDYLKIISKIGVIDTKP